MANRLIVVAIRPELSPPRNLADGHASEQGVKTIYSTLGENMMFKRIAALAALAAGAVLLTACNASVSAGDGTGTTVDVKLTTDGERVDCGEFDLKGSKQKLIAVRANGGVVGCADAFNVLDQYITRGTPSGGWACAPDDTTITCVKGDASAPDGLGFHTEHSPGALEPVNCGEVDVDGTKHTLTAQPAEYGLVGCTEAFNVIDEYLKVAAQERGANLNGTDLPSGWTCTTLDGETASIGCVKDPVGDKFGLAFSTVRA
jgi:hypothetical protein